MNVQQMESQPQQPQPQTRHYTWVFWVAFGITIAIMLTLIGVVTWLFLTQSITELYTWLEIIVSIAGIILFPLSLFAIVSKWLERERPASVPSLLQVTTPAMPAQQKPSSSLSQPQTSNVEDHPEKVSAIWNIPYRPNPYFTGRESVLEELHKRLMTTKAATLTQPQAISGLGGIGKTQIAVEYVYRHRDEYHDVVWVNAASRETIVASYLELAALLDLPEKQEQDQTEVVAAVMNWLTTNGQWLVIFDNADDLTIAEEFLPTNTTGHLLLTTRHQQPGAFPDCIDIDKMDKDEGTLLVLRRANLLARDAPLEQARMEERAQAERIVTAMDGLPLALDQAAAYIEETQCALLAFLGEYQKEQTQFLRRRGGTSKDHPLPIAVTWSLSFAQIEQTNVIAADLLQVCAFLAPDAIPEEVFTRGASELGSHFEGVKEHPAQLDETIAILRRFSLIHRNRDEHTISLHRLVQEVLRMDMDKPTRKMWAERCVRAMNEAFPNVDFTTWSQCERYLVHALHCARLIDEYTLDVSEAASLLHQTALYLYDRAQYKEAEPLYQDALRIKQKALPPEHPSTAATMHELARLYQAQGRYAEAEPLYQQALAMVEKILGSNHPSTKIARASYKQFLAEAKKRKISE